LPFLLGEPQQSTGGASAKASRVLGAEVADLVDGHDGIVIVGDHLALPHEVAQMFKVEPAFAFPQWCERVTGNE
jgi:hypothetical protein